jgi:hypothetical protein
MDEDIYPTKVMQRMDSILMLLNISVEEEAVNRIPLYHIHCPIKLTLFITGET